MFKEQKDAHLIRAMIMYGDYLLRVCYTYVQDWTVVDDLVEKMKQCHSYLSSVIDYWGKLKSLSNPEKEFFHFR
ncbi:hypothetical protein AMS59_01690 [Lysinibacillus sp. FJAT-14745]|uniref:hypothetical protein n=1 Tax=Lysinibacillus sp. FJAT-14745 TaxID=1704289 RepID=UPI0006AB85AC|nr:hypothetical protein [Lysinibacillus sp. FJAT-14745]KOP80147.1 hypothetical protein AMS59_01690 [Lysinibacillus sp. FJAT-14745]